MGWAWHELVTAEENSSKRGTFLHRKPDVKGTADVQSCFCATGSPKARLDAGPTDSNIEHCTPKPPVKPTLVTQISLYRAAENN